MSDRDEKQADGERGRAVQRLQAAVTQQRRLRDEREAAQNASGEAGVDASLRVADDQVVARERWLKWVDDSAD